MITNTLSTSTDVTVPVKVFTSTTTGAPIGGAVTGQRNAITTMALCNTGTPDITDESVNTIVTTIHIVPSGDSPTAANTVVSRLTVPAGETVFFSDEKLVLDAGDEVWVSTSVANELAVTISTLPV